jgi:hypothetical protein
MTTPPAAEREAGNSFCTACGAPVGGGWAFCPKCGTHVATEGPGSDEPHVRKADRPVLVAPVPVAAPILTAWAAAATLVALFPGYYKGGHSLASSPENLWYNILPIVGWLGAALLLAIPGASQVGAGLAVGVTVCSAPAYLAGIGAVFHGMDMPGVGFGLGILGIVLALAGTAFALLYLVRCKRWRVRSLVWWGTAAAALGAIYDTGDALNWTRITIRATTPGVTFNLSGTRSFHHDCCTLVQQRGWSLAQQLAILVLAVAVPLVAAAVFTRLGFGGAPIGIALGLASAPISAFVGLGAAITPASAGVPSATISTTNPVASQQPLPGLWVAILVATVLLLLGVAYLMARGMEAQGDKPPTWAPP